MFTVAFNTTGVSAYAGVITPESDNTVALLELHVRFKSGVSNGAAVGLVSTKFVVMLLSAVFVPK